MSLNCYEISTYKKMYLELKNVQNVLDVLLKTILKIKNNRLYKNLYSKNCRMLHILIHCSGVFGGKINIGNTSKNICGNLKKKLGDLP